MSTIPVVTSLCLIRASDIHELEEQLCHITIELERKHAELETLRQRVSQCTCFHAVECGFHDGVSPFPPQVEEL